MANNYNCNYCGSTRYSTQTRDIKDWEYGVGGSYDYLRCRQCGGVQIDPFPDLEDLRKAYAIDYHGYAEGERRGPLFSLLYVARDVMFQRKMRPLVGPGSRVLDVGCGQGDFLRGIKSIGVEDLTGIDFNADVIETLASHGIKGFAGTFAEFRASDNSFDLIAMNNYLEHTIDPCAELGQTFNLLRPGGHLVGEVPGFDSIERRLCGRFWGGNHVPRHTYQFDHGFLRQKLEAGGFVDINISHQLNTGHLALSVQNFLQRNQTELRHNPALHKGRSRYYVPLLLLFIPINFFFVALGKSGCVQFRARKPG